MKKALLFILACLSFNAVAMDKNENVTTTKWNKVLKKRRTTTPQIEKEFNQDEIKFQIQLYIDTQERDINKLTKTLKTLTFYINTVNTNKILNRFFKSDLLCLHRALIAFDFNKQDEAIVKLLLKHGADPNIPIEKDLDRKQFGHGTFYNGWTSMHIAVSLRLPGSVLEAMLDAKGDPFKKDQPGDEFQKGWSAFDLAFYYENEAAAQIFAKRFGLLKRKLNNSKTFKYSKLITFIEKCFQRQYCYDDTSGFSEIPNFKPRISIKLPKKNTIVLKALKHTKEPREPISFSESTQASSDQINITVTNRPQQLNTIMPNEIHNQKKDIKNNSQIKAIITHKCSRKSKNIKTITNNQLQPIHITNIRPSQILDGDDLLCLADQRYYVIPLFLFVLYLYVVGMG